ncbi:lipopolysaccharide heptosyltransferase II [Mucilaginibacter gynuensis]|uniref:Lipopolysaccharide heptosyltransferase II n=1 Tax=Mucilaginibacter gynuensis TaxID=1302236 RepID=A0ABP8H6K9_9SPHI
MRILIRLPNWLGDVVMSTAFVTAVRQLYPDAVVDVVIKKELAALAELIPGINKIHPFSKQEYKGLTGVYHFGKTLRNEKYDMYFNLPPSLSSAVMAYASGAKKRVGFGNEGGFFLLTKACKRPAGVHRVREYIALLEQFSGKTIPDEPVLLEVQNPAKDNNRVIINFNSEASSRRMPVAKGRELLNQLTAALPGHYFELVGAPKDSPYVEELLSGLNHADRLINSCGKTNLSGLTRLMAESKAILTTDSGPAHLANSVGLPTVVLFGAGNEHNTAPYNKEDLSVIRYGQLSCEPCVKNTCKLYGIPKCMELLNNQKIIEALSTFANHA